MADACFETSLNPVDVREMLGDPVQDTLGKAFIFYWPRFLTFDDEPEGVSPDED